MPLSRKTLSLKKSRQLQPKNPAIRLNDLEEILLAAILNKPREFLIAHPEFLSGLPERLSISQKQKFEGGRKKLRQGIPLAYVLGFKWFMGNQFFVNENVLIPRPETEMLVEKALELSEEIKPQKIIDVGTGSGAIIISLAEKLLKEKSSPKKIAIPIAELAGIDLSAKALAVAKKNAKQILNNPKKIKFIKGSLLKPLKKTLLNNSRVLILANLPYLSKKELSAPSIKHEPPLALYGGKKSYNKIGQLLKETAALHLKNSAILLEINYNQGKIIKNLAKKYLPGFETKIYKDLSGFDRLARIWSSGMPSRLLR